jgi:hypothetical protein
MAAAAPSHKAESFNWKRLWVVLGVIVGMVAIVVVVCVIWNSPTFSSLDRFLSSYLFRYLVFPIVSALVGIYVKFVTRNDQYRTFTKEDIAIGLDLMLTAFLLFLALTSDQSLALTAVHHDMMAASKGHPDQFQKLQAQADAITHFLTKSGWIIFLMCLGLWSASTFIRKWGWQSETELHPILGIAVPIVFGVVFLIAVMSEAAP